MTKVLQYTRTEETVIKVLENNAVRTLLNHLKIHSPDTYAHSLNVAAISAYIAGKMQINNQGKIIIVTGALLHDVGKMCIPRKILSKADKLTAKEWAGLSMHSEVSYLLTKDRFHVEVQKICRSHHEKLDGSGYPEGIVKIPLYCQIVTIADMYEAMVASRVYRGAVTHEKAMLELDKEKQQGRINVEIVEIIRNSNLLN